MKTKKAKLAIVNRSDWPAWFVAPVCRWIIDRAGIKWNYEITLPQYRELYDRAGRAGGCRRQRSRMNRRFIPRGSMRVGVAPFPYLETYHRYSWAPKFQINNRLEALIHLIAHESAHATIGHPDNFKRGGKVDRSAMEMACERFAHETVAEFRKVWPGKLRDRVKSLARAARIRARFAAGPRRFDPSAKLTKALADLARWESKLKRAANKVKKYRRAVRRYEGKLAAK